jgi:hypothetical protein
MRTLLVFLALCAPSQAAIAFVNVQAGGNSGVSSVATAGISHTAGNLLYVHGSFRQACASLTMAVTNTAGDTFTPIGSLTDNTTNMCSGQWYAKNIAGNGSDVVTLTVTGGAVTNVAVTVMQFSGLDTASPLDAAATATGAVSSNFTATTSAFSTAQANEVVACGLKTYNLGTNTAGSEGLGYTIPAGATDAYHGTHSAQYQIFSGIQSSVTASFTSDTAVINTIVCAAFKDGSAPPPTAPRRRIVN